MSRSPASIPASANAPTEASSARSEVVVPASTQCRCLIPVRWVIHSSDVSIIPARSPLVTTRGGRWLPMPMMRALVVIETPPGGTKATM